MRSKNMAKEVIQLFDVTDEERHAVAICKGSELGEVINHLSLTNVVNVLTLIRVILNSRRP